MPLKSCKNNIIIRSCVFPFRICNDYLSLYYHVILWTCFYYYFEDVVACGKVIEVVLNLGSSFGV